MSKKVAPGPRTRMESSIAKATTSARILDLVLAVLFAVMAYQADSETWKWGLGVCAAFCLMTAIKSPMPAMFDFASRILFKRKQG